MNDFDVSYVAATTTTHKSKSGFYFFGGLALVALLAILFANNFLQVFLIATAFAAFNAAIRSYKSRLDFPLEVEVTTYATIAMTMAFGLKAGIFTGIWSGFWGDVFTGLTPYTPITLGSYVLAALLAMLFPTSMFVFAGILITVIITGVSWVLYNITGSFTPFENFMYSLTELICNLYLFLALPWIARFLF